MNRRGSLGGGSVVGDWRWAGSYGVDADIIAKSHCSVEFIHCTHIQARLLSFVPFIRQRAVHGHHIVRKNAVQCIIPAKLHLVAREWGRGKILGLRNSDSPVPVFCNLKLVICQFFTYTIPA